VRLALGDPDALAELGAAAAAICDGLGAGRVARRMLGSRLALREAGMDDAMLLHEWRNNPSTRQFFLEPSAVTVEGHLAWMERALAASDRVLLLAELDARPIGCVRFDIAGRDAEISIYMDPGLVGRGLGTMVIESAVRYARTDLGPEVLRLLARVKPENTKSLRAFRSAGFLPDQEMLVCEVRR
jgi:RimJ/RimL family protein N-acetyltransferase